MTQQFAVSARIRNRSAQLLPGMVGAAIIYLAAAVAASPTIAATTATAATAGNVFTVKKTTVDDLKAVFATVQSSDRIKARSRVSGTIASLSVDEGSQVKAGQVIAIITDQKIALRLTAIDARIVALRSRLKTKKADLERSTKLKARGVVSQARLDADRTAYDIAVNDWKSARADRSVIERQGDEGKVLAPADGRVLVVPVTKGSVVLPGEEIATIAANNYILRLQLPERHARFLKQGDKVIVGSRGLSEQGKAVSEGRIEKVYPQLRDGHVVADAKVPDLGSYFVGERALVWISAGRRDSILIPRAYVFHRFGQDYVRLYRASRPPLDIVVQLGPTPTLASSIAQRSSLEVLTGLHEGDKLIKPEATTSRSVKP